MSKKMTRITRRKFLKSSAALGAFSILSPRGALQCPSSVAIVPPGERVNVAFIASGNKGYRNRLALLKSGLCNVVALCDVDLEREEPRKSSAAHPKARTFTDFRLMFDAMADEIDAVVVSTPDHSHFAATMLAMSLGKHVWCEKPLAHTFGQCERMIDLAARSGVVTQMGNQGHSGGNYFQFKAWSEAGVIKDVTRITAHMNSERRWHGWGATVKEYPTAPIPRNIDWDSWINAAAAHPYSERLHPENWRSWFDYGCGAFGDWGPHILDTCHRFLKLGLPEKITAVKRDGPNPLVFPQASTIKFAFPERKGMPACDVTWYDGLGNEPVVEAEHGDLVKDATTGKTSRRPFTARGAGKIIYAKDLVFQGGTHGGVLRVIPKDKFMDIRKTLPSYPRKNSDHWTNFLLACKGEEVARSPFSVGGPLTQVFHLGILAQRLGGEFEFDRAAKKITNNDTAQSLLDPAPRKGWEEFYKM